MIDFRRMRELMEKIPRVLWDVQQKEAMATRITSNITGMPRGGSGLNSSEYAVLLLIDARKAYQEAVDELEQMRNQLEPMINRLEDEGDRGMMRMRYIYGHTITEIAEVKFAHPRTVQRALERAEQQINESCR